MKRNEMNDLCAVTLARYDEMQQPNPNPAVLAACELFLAYAVRKAAPYPQSTKVTENDS